jgi:gluconate 2-dehydrogenase
MVIKMKPKVFIANKIPLKAEEYVANYCEYRKWDSEEPIPREILLKEVQEIEGLLNQAQNINAELLDRAPKLKVVSNMAVGYNNFDLKAINLRKVMGTNTPGILNETVADSVFALIMATARRICELDRFVKEGRWQKPIGEDLYGVDVHQATLGIIGMGRIGRAVAIRGKLGFDMKICYHDCVRNLLLEKELEARYCTLEELLKVADFVVMLTPLTPETNKMIGAREFAQMKSSALFINSSRGEVIDEDALGEALKNGKIRGAALDVYTKEPIDMDNPLLVLPNLITMPHIGSSVQKTRDDMAMLAVKNLVSALQGEKPPNLIPECNNLFD